MPNSARFSPRSPPLPLGQPRREGAQPAVPGLSPGAHSRSPGRGRAWRSHAVPSERAAASDVPACPRAGTTGARWLLIRVHAVLPAQKRFRGALPAPLPLRCRHRGSSGVWVRSQSAPERPGSCASPFGGTARGSLPHPGAPPADTRPRAGSCREQRGLNPSSPGRRHRGTESGTRGSACACVTRHSRG